MSDTTVSLTRKISSAGDLQSVVRTMKALAASSIGQYEKSVDALGDYYRSVELGLGLCFRQDSRPTNPSSAQKSDTASINAIVFGSDQGLVGQFNDIIADHAIACLGSFSGKITKVWAVGERVHARLVDANFPLAGPFEVPHSVQTIAPLVGQILMESESAPDGENKDTELYLFYNRPKSGAVYEPISQRLLPLDASWRAERAALPWPGKTLPERIGDHDTVLRALIREYLFISLFRACSESLASENASRLAAMERADKNIQELLDTLQSDFNRLRQSSIDEELFDVISGFEALSTDKSE